MNIGKTTISIFLIILGAFVFVYGGYDDSPGAQLIGLVLAVIGIVAIVKAIRNKKKKSDEAEF